MRNVFVSCNYPEETFTIIGMPRESNENGLPSGQIDGFKAGDFINPIYLNFNLSEDESENFEETAHAKYDKDLDLAIGSVTITLGGGKPQIENGTLPDGYYFYIFEFVNPVGGKNEYTKQGAIFTVQGGKIVSVKHDADIEDISDLK